MVLSLFLVSGWGTSSPPLFDSFFIGGSGSGQSVKNSGQNV
jgi:hypothetical protein